MPEYSIRLAVGVKCIADDEYAAARSAEEMVRKYLPTPAHVEWIGWRRITTPAQGGTNG